VLHELSLLFDSIKVLKVIDKVKFYFALARGLDYSTGLIFEAAFICSLTQDFTRERLAIAVSSGRRTSQLSSCTRRNPGERAVLAGGEIKGEIGGDSGAG
jgi:histidyl-tRNA synthetase